MKFTLLVMIFFIKTTFASISSDFVDEFDVKIESDNFLLKHYNQKIINFNDLIYSNLYSSIFETYNKDEYLIPRWIIKTMYENYNLNPKNFILSIFDFDLEAALISFWRFTINSTIGLFGIVDIASKFELPNVNKELGTVLATYHVPDGPFIVLPFIGPTILRHSFDELFTLSINLPLLLTPLNIISYSYFLSPFGIINNYGSIFGYISFYSSLNIFHKLNYNSIDNGILNEASFDKYATMKSFTIQRYNQIISYNKSIKNKRLKSNNDYYNNIKSIFNEEKIENIKYEFEFINTKEIVKNEFIFK